MANATPAELTQRLEDLHEEYRQHFAGRSRVSREADRLDGLMARVQQVMDEADGAPQVLGLGQQRIDLYRSEAQLIREAQAGGPDVVEASGLHDGGFLALRRYARNFGGRPRASRDLGLLDELTEEQRRMQRRFDVLATRHEPGWQADVRGLLASNIQLFESERKAIVDSRKALPAAEKISVLARRANEQFSAYRVHFADKPRRSRHLPLLQRILSNLEVILAEMKALRDNGDGNAVNTENIGKVDSRVQHHRKELTQIQQARAQLRPGELSAGLADGANALFKRYREQFAGRQRREVDPEALNDINEQLQVIMRQMQALHDEAGLPANAGNLEIVIDNLKRYEREYEAVIAAKRST